MPTAKTPLRIPTAAAVQEPRQRGHLRRRARALPAAEAEEAGAYILTETAATQLLVEDGARRRRALRRQGPRQGRRAARQLRARHRHQGAGRPCWPRAAGATSPAPRSASSTSARAASRRSGSSASRRSGRSRSRSTASSTRSALAAAASRRKYGQIGGTWIYPMKDEKTGDDLVSIGFVVDLDYADATTSAHDLLQQFKTAPARQEDPRGRRARRLGREGAARAAATGRCRSSRCPARCSSATPAAWSTRSRSRASTTRINSGMLAAEAIYAPLKRGEHRLRALRGRDRGLVRSARSSTRCATRASRSRRASSWAARSSTCTIATKGSSPAARWHWHRNDEKPMFIGKTQGQLPEAGRQVHVRQALERLHHRQRDARRRAEPHPRAEARPARGRRDVGVDVPGRRVRDPRRRARDTATST